MTQKETADLRSEYVAAGETANAALPDEAKVVQSRSDDKLGNANHHHSHYARGLLEQFVTEENISVTKVSDPARPGPRTG